jgi:hypothetical protein
MVGGGFLLLLWFFSVLGGTWRSSGERVVAMMMREVGVQE